MSLAQKAGKAGLLLFARKIWGGLVNIGVMAYLARTLNKEDFGLVAISGVLIGFIQVFALSGIGEYVVFYQGKKDEKEVVNAAFWLNLILTIAVACIVLIAAPFWARSYDDARILNLIWLLLIGFVFSSLSTMPNALFRKELNYAPMIKVQTIFGTLSQLSQVLFAWLGFGVYALALPNAIITPLLAITLFWVSGFRPDRNFGKKYWRQIFAYTKNVIGARVLGKFANEGDTLLIGKVLGMEALGVYDIAFKLANLINGQLVPIITNVSLPVFAKNQSDLIVVREHFFKMIRLLSLLLPLFLGLILFAPEIVRMLYGAKWEVAIMPLQILTGFSLVRSLGSPASGLYNALGKPYIGFYFTLAFTPVFLSVIYFTATWGGLIAACFGVMTLRNLGSIFHFYMAGFLLNFNFRDFLLNIFPLLVTGMFIFVLFSQLPIYSLVQKLIIYIVLWGVIMVTFFYDFLQNEFAMLKKMLNFR